jgi:carbonic anhydrase
MNARALAVLLVLAGPAAAEAPASAPVVTAAEALARLKAGNERVASGRSLVHPYLKEIAATAGGQHPFAAVLACMDSRVGPEIVFDQGIGDVFSVRVAGNVADEDALGSLEYATKLAGARLIVVLGHTHCGAVKGACDGERLGHLTGLLARMKPALDAVPASVSPRTSRNDDFVARVARENVRLSMRTIREKSPVIAALEKAGDVRIVGAIYDVETGRAEFLE